MRSARKTVNSSDSYNELYVWAYTNIKDIKSRIKDGKVSKDSKQIRNFIMR